MASIWKLGGVDIYVNAENDGGEIRIAELIPLDSQGTSILHGFGTGTDTISIGGKVFTETNKNTLRGFKTAQSGVALVSDQGTVGTFIITQWSLKRVDAKKVFIPGVAEDATVYDFDFTLKKV